MIECALGSSAPSFASSKIYNVNEQNVEPCHERYHIVYVCTKARDV